MLSPSPTSGVCARAPMGTSRLSPKMTERDFMWKVASAHDTTDSGELLLRHVRQVMFLGLAFPMLAQQRQRQAIIRQLVPLVLQHYSHSFTAVPYCRSNSYYSPCMKLGANSEGR